MTQPDHVASADPRVLRRAIPGWQRPWRRLAMPWDLFRAHCFGRRAMCGQVELLGSAPFLERTAQAIRLLQTGCPDAHQLLERHVAFIAEARRSGVFAPVLRIMPKTGVVIRLHPQQSLEEYAAGLAHEAFHCELYRKAQGGDPSRRPPPEAYSGEPGESASLAYQCGVLTALGVPEARIAQIRGVIHTRWWEVPPEARDW